MTRILKKEEDSKYLNVKSGKIFNMKNANNEISGKLKNTLVYCNPIVKKILEGLLNAGMEPAEIFSLRVENMRVKSDLIELELPRKTGSEGKKWQLRGSVVSDFRKYLLEKKPKEFIFYAEIVSPSMFRDFLLP